YYFLSPEEFRERINNDEFLEYEEVYPNRYYGTLKSEVDRILKEGSNVIFDVDCVGGLNIKKIYGDQALSIFIMPPSIDSLRERLENIRTDSSKVIKFPLAKAEYFITYSPLFDVKICNDDN